MESITTQQLLLAGLGVVCAGMVLVVALWLRRRLRGRPASVFRRISQQQLNDVLIDDGLEGEIHLEHVMLTVHGVLVVDLRNASGAVFGGPRLEQWKVMDGQRRFAFKNPLEALAARVHAVERLVGAVPVAGRVVFAGPVEFPGGRLPQVSTLADLEHEFGEHGDGKAIDAFQHGWTLLSQAASPHRHS
ncbi:MAG: nuclease-related domain-containing protein [Gammaproteobacteria bacterium]